MHEFETWLDLTCVVGEERQTVCTLFARHAFPVRPLAGERVSFWSHQDRPACFSLMTGVGPVPQHYVATAVEEVSHSFSPGGTGGEGLAGTGLRLAGVEAATLEDARLVVDFLSRQYGFAVDPFGPNLLDRDPSEEMAEPASADASAASENALSPETQGP